MKLRRSAVGALVLGLLSQVALTQSVGADIDDLAKELASPGATNSMPNVKFECRTLDGELPNADDQVSFDTTLRHVFPFVLFDRNNLVSKPAFANTFAQPAFDAGCGDFNNGSAFEDIAFELHYVGSSGGWVMGGGVVAAVPSGAGIASVNLLLGPSAWAVKTEDWGVLGFLPFPNEKVSDSGSDIPTRTLQCFVLFGLKESWQVGTGPAIPQVLKADSNDA